jgi:hypothetical protein
MHGLNGPIQEPKKLVILRLMFFLMTFGKMPKQ